MNKMKFYYAKFPHSSLPVHIVLEELGIEYLPIRIDLTQEPSAELFRVNPVGGVPVLEFKNGEFLTEIAAILQYLADKQPKAKLAPKEGSLERYRLQEWLHFIGTEIHKGFWPFGFLENIPERSSKENLHRLILENLEFKLGVVAQKLETGLFALKSGYSVADAYLFTVLTWTHGVGLDLSRWPILRSYMELIAKRPATIRAVDKAKSP